MSTPAMKRPERQSASPTPSDATTAPAVAELVVVGIGASAGGLPALQAFFAALPPEPGMAFVVILHLAPEYESLLAELLQPHTAMPVRQVTGPVPLAANHVYVIPPGQELSVADGTLTVTPFSEPRGQRAPIDRFFRTLAAHHGEGAAIILSGTGSDGAVGIQAIKEKGGLLLVQDPAEAEYDGMPRSAIATGLIDGVFPVRALAQELLAYQQSKTQIQLLSEPAALTGENQEALQQTLALLRVRTGHDFNHYKQATLLRRLARRLQVTHTLTLADYLSFVRRQPDELTALFQDLLIGVTQFFRDPTAWAALEAEVLPHLFANKRPSDPVRVWVVGCATGEEAYSLAILLLEQAARLAVVPEIQIFASDLDERALQVARHGRYPAAIATDVSEARLARFFRAEGDYYQVTSDLRDRILFTQHNVLHDPPFSKLDLISCRNVLIYFERALQVQVFDLFAYALYPTGYLFLGTAETADELSQRFRPLNKKQHLYQHQGPRGPLPVVPTLPTLNARLLSAGQEEAAGRSQQTLITHHVQQLEDHAPPSVLVDEDYQVLYLSETAGRYLYHPSGLPTKEVTQLIRPELQAELRLALYQAFAANRTTMTRPLRVQFNGTATQLSLHVRPRPALAGKRLALVFFLEDEGAEAGERLPASAATPEAGALLQQREAENRQLREHMQTMQEEHVTAQEELKAANEELQSTNEEYKATLEELETGKEELQSLNEELQTLNQELKNKVEEVSQAHNDLENLLVSTEIATLFLDRDLAIRRYTPRMAELLHVMPSDRGRPIGHLRLQLAYATLEADARAVLRNLLPLERELTSEDGRWFLVRLRPYRTREDRIEGVILTFIDITALKVAEQQLQVTKEYAEKIIETIHEPLLVLDPHLQVKLVNPAFYTTFQVQSDQSIGRYLYELGNGQWDIPALRSLLEDVLPDDKAFNNYEMTHRFEQLGERTMVLNARRLDHLQLILLAIEDITVRKAAEAQLHTLNQRLAETVAVRTADLARRNGELEQFVYVASHDLRAPLRAMTHLINWLTEELASALSPKAQEYLHKLRHRVQRLEILLTDLVVYARAGDRFAPPERVDTALLVHNLAELLEAPAGFRLVADSSLPILVTERIPLETILRNLIGNAIKHHDHPATGQVVVAAQVVDSWVEFRVTDDGPGIAPAAHDAIFHLFEKLPARDEMEGSGLGLALVKKTVESRGGTVHVESSVGQGATFRFTWPKAPLSAPPA